MKINLLTAAGHMVNKLLCWLHILANQILKESMSPHPRTSANVTGGMSSCRTAEASASPQGVSGFCCSPGKGKSFDSPKRFSLKVKHLIRQDAHAESSDEFPHLLDAHYNSCYNNRMYQKGVMRNNTSVNAFSLISASVQINGEWSVCLLTR